MIESSKWVRTTQDLYSIIKIDKALEILSEKFGLSKKDVLSCNTWLELGFDDLDQVEFIMELEKEYGIAISDDIVSDMYESGFSQFKGMLLSIQRSEKLNEIGI